MKKQLGFFCDGQDSPLFSGVPQTVKLSVFVPGPDPKVETMAKPLPGQIDIFGNIIQEEGQK